nr:MAG TPA: hypothetical protein [Caudoviricetes sp.]
MCKVYAPCHGIVFINYLTNLIPSKSISYSTFLFNVQGLCPLPWHCFYKLFN